MRLCRLATWALVFGLSLPGLAAEQLGVISGFVRNAAGTPQMGAVVEVFCSANRSLTVFTDADGFYTAAGLLPGLYSLKVTAPSFLPALREKVGLRPGASLNINVTLSTLLGMMELGPVRRTRDDDDWKWTLRSVANRPILRVFEDPIAPSEEQKHEFSGTVSFVAGSLADGYGTGSDLSTGFTLERQVSSDGLLEFSGNVGYGASLPTAVLRTGYSRRLVNGSNPSFALSVRRFAPTDPFLNNATLQSAALSAGDRFSLGDVLELRFGSQLQTIQFLGHLNAFRPYGSADLHLSSNTVVEYSYTTSRPDLLSGREFDSATTALGDSDPHVSVLGYAPQIESVHHQEISVSRRVGRNNFQLAAFSDRVLNPALTGTGDVTAAGGFLVPDMASGTFSYTGPNFATGGARLVLQRKFSSDLTGTLDYAYGGVLDFTRPDAPLDGGQQWISTQHRHAVAARLSGTVARTHTRWITSYRWISGPAVTPVDMFNASPGQTEPYLNLFIRQPIGSHLVALIDIRNLLAQGYVPVLGQDGQTVYLVSSARCIRGGVAFNF